MKLTDEDLSSLLYRINEKTHGVLEFPEYLQVCNNSTFRNKARSFPGSRFTNCSMSSIPIVMARSSLMNISRSEICVMFPCCLDIFY